VLLLQGLEGAFRKLRSMITCNPNADQGQTHRL